MFSEKFNIDTKLLDEYGAVDISLSADIPMFIDPILIFNSDNIKYKELHENIIKYMYFLSKKAELKLSDKEIKTWFTFNEVCNNWLGYSLKGNKGAALDIEFAKLLYKNISFILNNNGISKGIHAEKIMLIHPGSGKDKISDMTVNLIKGFLCEYTQNFTQNNIKQNAKTFYVDKAEFNYDTETFVSKEYYLPYVINENGKEEYILLTPKNILRYQEPAINRSDFISNYNYVRQSIDNDSLRVQVGDYINKAVKEYHDLCENMKKVPKQKVEEKIRMNAFEEMAEMYPEIYDYYIKLKEDAKNEIKSLATVETEQQMIKFISNVKKIVKMVDNNKDLFNNSKNAFEESKKRIEWFKSVIENQDLYKNFYDPSTGERLLNYENELQRMFKLVWMQSAFKPDMESNNGRGPADVVVSYGATDVCIIEFKLASNNQLEHVFKQIDVYKAAHRTTEDIAVIFYFDNSEYDKVNKILKKLDKVSQINNTVYLIDCRKKLSASKVK